MSVGVEYLTFDILLHVKSKQNVIGNSFCTPIIFQNPLQTGFSLQFVTGVFKIWIAICICFLFEKQVFHFQRRLPSGV